MRKLKTRFPILLLVIACFASADGLTQVLPTDSVALVLVGDSDGVVTAMAPAIVIKSSGTLLMPYHVLKGAKQVQVRFKNGEIFDNVVRLDADDRRNVAAISIQASGLLAPEPVGVESGDDVVIVSHAPGKTWMVTHGKVKSVGLADKVPGAGQGFQVFQFDAQLKGHSTGGIVFNSAGKPVGLITSEITDTSSSGFAVPFQNVIALGEGARAGAFDSGKALILPSALDSVKKPTSDPRELLLRAKTVYIDSNSSMFKEHQLITELNKRKEIREWGWTFITGSWEARNKADIIIELDHQVLTFDFTFTIRDRRTSILIAAGKVIIAGGAGGAPKMANSIIKNVADVMMGKMSAGK